MTKKEFISELQKMLSKLPSREVRERLIFYSEMIDDKIEEGFTEEDAVDSIGSPIQIAAQISNDIKLQKKKKAHK